MKRVFNAFLNSVHALNYLLRHEKAVFQEAIVLVLSIPFAIFFAKGFGEFLLLVSAILFVLIIEIINTAIEACCNAQTRDYREDIKIAKDAGSLAVLLAIVLAFAIWSWIVIKSLFFM